MIQDYCRKPMVRAGKIEQCGRVLRTDGGCENERLHLRGSVVAARRASR